MPIFKLSCLILTGVGLIACCAGLALADSCNDMALAVGVAAIPKAPAMIFSTFVHGSIEREEMSIVTPISLHVAVLEDSAKNTFTLLDPARKLYATEPLSAAPTDLLGIANVTPLFTPSAGSASAGTLTGTITDTMTVKDLGMQAAPATGVMAHHFGVSAHRAATGASADRDSTRYYDIWTDPSMQRPASPAREQSPRIIIMPNGAHITYTLAGDAAVYQTLTRFLPVEIRINSSETPVNFIRTSSTTSTQDPSLFTVPADYRQITLQEFATTQENSILDAVSGPQPKVGGQ